MSGALVRVGTGPLRPHYPERGPFGDTWIDPSEVVAVESHDRDVYYRDLSKVVLRSGHAVVVYGTVDEVLADLATPQSAPPAQEYLSPSDWTAGPDGVANTSQKYLDLVMEVERLIRSDAHQLLSGREDRTARLIVSNLAHKYGLAPRPDGA